MFKRFRRKHGGSSKPNRPETPSNASSTASHPSESALPSDQTPSTLESAQRLPAPQTPQGSSKESERWADLKQTALGTLKTFLELGALASQTLPTGMVKGILECSSYMIKMVEVSYHRVQGRTLGTNENGAPLDDRR